MLRNLTKCYDTFSCKVYKIIQACHMPNQFFISINKCFNDNIKTINIKNQDMT